MDMWTAKKRSQVMAKVRSRGNLSTEEALAKAFRWLGVTGWRRHLPEKIGNRSVRPDFVFCKARLVMFVHGCFWHGCPRHATMPANNRAFWKAKLARNTARDRGVTRELRKAGWRVWECALTRSRARATLARIDRALAAGG